MYKRQDLYVRKATLEYEGSARYDDQLEVGIRCARLGKSSLVFGAAAFRGEQRLVHGDLVYVFADPATQTSRPVPEPLRDVLNAYERGEPMLDVRTGTWDAVGREAQVLRHAVFVQEQRIPAELEWDAADAGAVHAVACNRFGLALGTALALMKLSQIGPYRWIATIYTEVFRGVPAIIVLLAFSLISLAIPGLQIPFDPFGAVWTALGLVAAAYMSETIRAGIQAVPKGQTEAARSLGMPSGMATRKIVLPQAFRIVTPPLTNELVSLTKDSSLIYVIGLSAEAFDLTKYGRDLTNTHSNMTPLVIAGLTYLVITLPLTFLVRRMEAKATKAR